MSLFDNETFHTHTVTAPGSVAGFRTWSLVTNTTAVLPTAADCCRLLPIYLAMWAGGNPQPLISNLNALPDGSNAPDAWLTPPARPPDGG